MTIPATPVWVLASNRSGEIAQQRAIAIALGLPFREVAVATLAPGGSNAQFDFDALQPPWPRLAISFGKTLRAAIELRRRSGGRVRIVQIGRPRGINWEALDLFIPMPQDVVPETRNMLRVQMPFNPHRGGVAANVSKRLAASPLPRPWTLLALGGVSRQYRFDTAVAKQLLRAAIEHVRAHSGSLLLTTSPRTPADVAVLLASPLPVPSECYIFRRDDPDNPFTTYASLADEIIVSGDSPSMVAECWRSGTPVLVQPLRRTSHYWWKQQCLGRIPDPLMRSGYFTATVDINAWLDRQAARGRIGLFGRSRPRLPYSPDDDDDLAQVVARIREIIAIPSASRRLRP